MKYVTTVESSTCFLSAVLTKRKCPHFPDVQDVEVSAAKLASSEVSLRLLERFISDEFKS